MPSIHTQSSFHAMTTHIEKTHANPTAKFGAFIRDRRIALGLSAREIATASGIQPSNLSRMEHGTLAPAKDDSRLRDLAIALALIDSDEDFIQFSDLAAKATGSMPLDIKEIISQDEAVPLLLRSIAGRKLTKKKIAAIVSLVRGEDK